MSRWSRILGLFLAATLAMAVHAAPAWAEKRVALVIGNSTYGSLGNLPNPVNDAKLIERTLKGLGFTVTTVTDADQRAMKRAILQFGESLRMAGQDTVGLFFYAGHGIQVRGENYLIPAKAQLQSEADVEVEAVNAAWVLAQMEYAGNRVNIVVLDACRNNPLPQRSVRSSGTGLARMDAPRGSLVAYSTAPGGVAVDGAQNNSPYASALAREMQVPGASLEDVFRKTRISVLQATGQQQVPWESSSLTADFFFNAQTVVVVPPTPAVPSTPDPQIELAFWNAIKDSTNPADFDAYVTQFPRGNFVALAKVRRDQLGRGGSQAARPVVSSQGQAAQQAAAAEAERRRQEMATREQEVQRQQQALEEARVALAEQQADAAAQQAAAQQAAQQAAARQQQPPQQTAMLVPPPQPAVGGAAVWSGTLVLSTFAKSKTEVPVSVQVQDNRFTGQVLIGRDYWTLSGGVDAAGRLVGAKLVNGNNGYRITGGLGTARGEYWAPQIQGYNDQVRPNSPYRLDWTMTQTQ
ncbi:caspase family protein [Zavarzinia sp. CC-PAN008]|uniref:caspase family protein n=1 Tax=Zavarzinia sp. CC-PAN008 TaxID=3243332 RepID=UPI003F749EDD